MKNIEIGAWLMSGNSTIAEAMASSKGISYVCIDLEHTSTSLRETENAIRAIQIKNKEAFVRISSHDYSQVKRILDMGADGIIIPDIRRSEELDAVIRSAFYTPIGSRGVGLYRAQEFGQNFNNYLNFTSKKIKVIAQIEHYVGIENLFDILSNKNLYGTFIGPFDLSSSINKPGDFNDIKVENLLKKYLEVAKRFNKKIGIHVVYPEINAIKEKINDGYNFIAYGTDLLILQEELNKI